MLDTLALAFILATGADRLPNRPAPEIRMVSVAKASWIQTIAYPEGAEAPEASTTCYLQNADSCWSDR